MDGEASLLGKLPARYGFQIDLRCLGFALGNRPDPEIGFTIIIRAAGMAQQYLGDTPARSVE
jgi:hypothetical protein